ncbi:MAG TPA: SGNH/GDSL hydrolase family protein [Azospirillaceae bacterium]|nr:SGNH/GDSL hydrolase family protein [Azospirillaceae bacterium]
MGLAPKAGSTAAPTSLVVLGDSLSDTGNAGRFSNGPVWVEHIAEAIGTTLRPARTGGTNFAVGGARTHGGTIDMRVQADALLAHRRQELRPGTLVIAYGGGNDLLAAAFSPDRDRAARQAAAALVDIVDDLAGAGARLILVPNLPDIGRTPAVRSQGAAVVKEGRRLSQLFNANLEAGLKQVEGRRDTRIVRLDVFALAEKVIADPASGGFRDVTSPCQARGGCEAALFWDQIHPTAYAHRRLARAALESLGLPAESLEARR